MWILIIWIIIIILSIISIMAFLLFIIKFKKNALIYKSIFTSLFKSVTSVIIIIVFYSVTFSLIGTFYSYSEQIEESLYPLIIDSKPNQVNYAGITLNSLEDDNDNYNNLFEFSISRLNSDFDIGDVILETDEDLINEYDLFFESEYSISNFWGNYGSLYFQNIENFIASLVFETTFSNFNDGLIDDEIDDNGSNYEIVYNFFPHYIYQPVVSDSYNEIYFLMGYNQFQTKWSPLFRYSGKNNNYVIDNIIITEYAPGYDDETIENELTQVGDSYDENGTKNSPFKIIIQEEYLDANDIDLSKEGENILKINDYYFEIMASACFSNVIAPVYSSTNFITDFSSQSTFLMNPESLVKITNGKLEYSFDFGFTDFYDKADNIYYYRDMGLDEDNHSEIYDRTYELEDYIYDSTKTNNIPIVSDRSINLDDVGMITGENYSLNSYRTNGVLDELNNETIFANVFMYIFLIIIVFVLILLIQKRVKDYSKQFGTLKALGLNRHEASVSFIMYPLVIILVAGFIALLLSIPLQMYTLGLFHSFFSLPGLTFGFSFWSVFYVVFLPALILFGIAVIISNYILRKSPIDLLSNKINDDPSAIVVYSGKLVPKNASFSYAYKFKGLSRAWGKSLLLLFAVFIATALTSLSFAARNIITNTQELAAEGFNFEYYSSINETKYEYDFYDLNEQEGDYKSNQDPLYNDELLTFNEINQIESDISSNPDIVYQDLGEVILNPINGTNGIETEVVSNNVVNYYIPKEALLNFCIVIDLFEESNYYSLLTTPWEGSEYSAIDFLNISNLFSINIDLSLNKMGSELTFDDVLNEIINGADVSSYLDYAPDIVFKDIYYDSLNQALATGGNVKFEYIDEEDSENRFNIDYDSVRLNIFKYSDSINKVYELPQESYQKLVEQEDLVDQYGELDYIPVVVDSFTFNYLRVLAPGIFTYDESDQSYNTDELFLTDKDNEIYREPISVKVFPYQSNLAVGFTTTEKLIQNYSGWNFLTNMNKIYYQNIYWTSYLTPTQEETFKPPQTLTIVPINQYASENNGETLTFEEYIDNSKSLETAPLSKKSISNQTDFLYELVNGFLLLLSLFSLMVALILTVIAIKDVNDKSKKEVAMLKAIGYSNWKSTSLVLTPYIIIIIIGFILSIPFAFLMLFGISNVLNNLTGTSFTFAVNSIQWIYITIFIVGLLLILLMMAYNAFRKTNPLDAIKEEN
ncbi:MAG: hypothetical protein HPAVJP_0170 [Candidatus Hepatoplasma vulgare]|nr:MAG: hypothetical protein HPAVJP_0170 [Candidatus Hepatoplasma sp.]